MLQHLFKRSFTLGAVGLLAIGFSSGCGSPGEGPADCRADQYYDDVQGRCVLCPAASAPTCNPGCGIEIFENERGCPAARCELECTPSTDDRGDAGGHPDADDPEQDATPSEQGDASADDGDVDTDG
jgi:hypothetical protein